jgi:hypothetical protein
MTKAGILEDTSAPPVLHRAESENQGVERWPAEPLLQRALCRMRGRCRSLTAGARQEQQQHRLPGRLIVALNIA